MNKNTVVRGCLVPSLKNKPLDGRQDVPTLADIANIENPYVNFIFPVEETGKWYKVVSLTDKVIDELVIPNGMIDEYEEFGGGMTDTQKQEYLTKQLAELTYVKKEDAEAEYLKKEDAEETYQPKGEYLTNEEAQEAYQPKGEYATTEQLEDLENRISQGGGGCEGGYFIDAPSDGKTYGRKDGLWQELKDAPEDGVAYARMNGKWAAIESGNALDPLLPILSVNIGSTLENDLKIEKISAIVSFADKVFEVPNGGKMNVPYGLNITVDFPDVDDYATPGVLAFESVQGNINAEGTYTYLRESVDVYVSADDNSSVDGQVVTVGKLVRRPNGVYIEDKTGKLWTEEEWDGSAEFSSIAVVADDKAFGIHNTMKYAILAPEGTSSTSVPTYSSSNVYSDFDGIGNTSNIKTYYSGAGSDTLVYWIKNFKFKTNKSAFIPAMGQLQLIHKNKDKINELLKLVGEGGISTHYVRSSSFSSFSSSIQESWCLYGGSLERTSVDVYNTMYGTVGCHACCEITEEQCLYTPEPEQHEVLGGKVSFGAKAGDNVYVSITSKGDDYRTPDDVSHLVTLGENNIQMVYNRLYIDTIYINNLIADTDSIISGEMNGAAVQAIWNGVHRYLGKIVKKEDSTNELVLLDIDQNDNRYYTDGSMIDLEALGTNAYFFTKIPSMAYKITQMSDNIYKVQISYKHKPSGEGWKFFDELIVPTFAASYIENSSLPVYFQYCGNRYNPNTNTKYLNSFDLFDYSTMVLLCCAKYGIDNTFNAIEASEFNENFSKESGSTVHVYNGYSLANGVKDGRFHFYTKDKDTYVYSILGVENLINYIYNLNSYGNIGAVETGGGLMSSDGNYSKFENFQFNNSASKAVITYRDKTTKSYGVNFENGVNHIKSLFIDDYFLSIPKTVGATDETYYKSKMYAYSISSMSTGYISTKGVLDMYLYTYSNSYTVRVKIVCPHRIESDRDAFNALTNIWKD